MKSHKLDYKHSCRSRIAAYNDSIKSFFHNFKDIQTKELITFRSDTS